MEKKEFSSPVRRYGKFFIAFIFITAGVLLLDGFLIPCLVFWFPGKCY